MNDREKKLEELITEMYVHFVYLSLKLQDPLVFDDRFTEEQTQLLTEVIHKYQPPKEKSVTIRRN